MTLDISAAAALKDGNYANGEQYVYTASALSPGAHNYYFEASDGTDTACLPSSGTLSGPTVSDPTITTTSLPDGNVGVAYLATLNATGGSGGYSWWISSFALPSGLNYRTVPPVGTGEIYGTPTQTAFTMMTLKVIDSALLEYSTYLWITINPAPDTTPPTGTIPINLAAPSTNSAAALLSLTCSDTFGCTQMRFSDDGVTWSTWEANAALGAGASSAGSTSVTVPASTAPGIYYIGAIADASAMNAESNETNNTASQAVTIFP